MICLVTNNEQLEILNRLAEKLNVLETSGNEYMEEIVIDDDSIIAEISKVSSISFDIDDIVYLILGFCSLSKKAPIKVIKRHIFILNDIITLSEELNLRCETFQDFSNREEQIKSLVDLIDDSLKLSYILICTSNLVSVINKQIVCVK